MKQFPKMAKPSRHNAWYSRALESFRQRLAHREALPQLAVLGLISGLLTAVVAILFRLGIEWPLHLLLPGEGSEDFESLAAVTRLMLPFAGALGVGLLFQVTGKSNTDTGVSYVIRRYQQHQGHLSATSVSAIHPRATLQEALVLIKKENLHAIYVSRPSPPLMSDVAGILPARISTSTTIRSLYV